MRGDSEYLADLIPMVEFLGRVLGPSHEVVLHDTSKLHGSIVAIANGELSGRQVGSPATDLLLRIVRDNLHADRDYITGYDGHAADRRRLAGSTYFLKREGRLIGTLCINRDESALHALAAATDRVLRTLLPVTAERERPEADETLSGSMEGIVTQAVGQVSDATGTLRDHFGVDDRLAVVRLLHDRGFFQLKGAVPMAAQQLEVSEPSVYRYLAMVRREADQDKAS